MSLILALLIFGFINHLTVCIDLHEKEKEILDYNISPERYDMRIRPPGTNASDRSPVTVHINFFVRSITALDDQKMEYNLQLTFRQLWTDTRLKYDNQNGKLPYLTLKKPRQIWEPDLFFENENNGHFHDMMVPNLYFRIFPDGYILYSRRLSLSLGCPMDLRFFPFDQQTCTIRISSYGHTTQDLILLWKAYDPIQVVRTLFIAKFTMEKFSTDYCNSKTSFGEYSCVKAEFIFKRNFYFYFIQIYLPSIMLVFLSFTTFWFSPTAIQPRMILGLSTLLGLAIQTSIVDSSIPQVSYTKPVDIWAGVCITFVFLAYLEFCTVHYVYRSKLYNPIGKKPEEGDFLQNDLDCDSDNAFTLKSLSRSDQPLTPKCTIREQIRNLNCFKNWFKRFSHRAKAIDVLSRILFPSSFLIFIFTYFLYYAI